MKHIFWVHSHITYLITTSIIEYHSIDDAVILLTRNYTIPFETKAKVYSFPYYYTPNISKHKLIYNFNIFKSLKLIKHCNALINKITDNEEFILYIPFFNQPAIQCFIEHTNCHKFYYIEEGSASYRSLEYFKNNSFKEKMKSAYIRLLPYSNLLGRDFYNKNHSKFFGTYSFFDNAFIWNDSNEKYILPFYQTEDVQKIDADAFLFFDALVEFGHITMDLFIKILEDVIQNFISDGYEKISYKFHPEQLNEINNKNKIKKTLDSYSDLISFDELDSDFIAEIYFMQYKSIVFVFLSSVGIYAKKCNSSVFSLMRFFEKHDEGFYNKYKSRVLI